MMKKKDNIILIGFMGSGKTSVGKSLANTIDYIFRDTDDMIESKQNMAISKIFEDHGEEHFRDLETDLLLSLKDNLTKTVLSTGGGMPIRDTNVKLLGHMGKIIYLRASQSTIIERVSRDATRPLLKGGDLKESVERLLSQRASIYKHSADIIIDTDNLTIGNIVDKILKFIGHD